MPITPTAYVIHKAPCPHCTVGPKPVHVWCKACEDNGVVTTEMPLVEALQALPDWPQVQTLRGLVVMLHSEIQSLQDYLGLPLMPPLPLQALGLTPAAEEAMELARIKAEREDVSHE